MTGPKDCALHGQLKPLE